MAVALKSVSKLLNRNKVYHNVIGNNIVTRRARVFIPRIRGIEIAYLCGVITGDGSIKMCPRKRGGFHYKIQITSDTEEYLRKLDDIFFYLFNNRGYLSKDKRKNAFNLVFSNAAIFWYFVSIGLPIGKKGELTVPIQFKQKKYFFHFLKGLVETDGSIKGHMVQLKQKSKKLLIQITKLLKKYSVNYNPPKVNYTNGKPFYYIRFDTIVP